jgi:hypothetical protein
VIYAIDKRSNQIAGPFWYCAIQFPGNVIYPPMERFEIAVNIRGTQNLGSLTLRHSVTQEHLDQMVLRLRIPEAERHIRVCFAVNVRNAIVISENSRSASPRN